MTVKHNPGPWVKDGIHYIDRNGQKVVISDNPSFGSAATWPHAAANSRLILASPKLLSALQDLLDVVTGEKEGDAVAVMNAQSAINEATGRTA